MKWSHRWLQRKQHRPVTWYPRLELLQDVQTLPCLFGTETHGNTSSCPPGTCKVLHGGAELSSFLSLRGKTVRKLSVERSDPVAGGWIGALLGLPWTLSQRVCWRRVNEDFIWQRNFTAHNNTHTHTLDVAHQQRILLPVQELKWGTGEAGATRIGTKLPPPVS